APGQHGQPQAAEDPAETHQAGDVVRGQLQRLDQVLGGLGSLPRLQSAPDAEVVVKGGADGPDDQPGDGHRRARPHDDAHGRSASSAASATRARALTTTPNRWTRYSHSQGRRRAPMAGKSSVRKNIPTRRGSSTQPPQSMSVPARKRHPVTSVVKSRSIEPP